jgi:hypothetical protein
MSCKENLFDRIRNRLSPVRAAITVATLQKAAIREEISNRAAQEAEALLRHYRTQARCAIREYRQWQADRAVSETLQALRDQEGRMLHGQARAKASLYLDAMRDHRDLINLSISQYGDAEMPDEEKARQPDRLHGLCSKG